MPFSHIPEKNTTSKSKMANKATKVIQFRHERLRLICDWDGCSDVFHEMGEFSRHIKSHLASHPADDLNCRWKECGHLAGSVQEYHVHINYHGFHTKAKCLGGNLLARTGLKNCALTSVNPNLLPELPDKLVCSWADCGENHHNPEIYYRHVDQHAYDVLGEAAKCLWEGCEGKFHTCSKMREHLRSHTQEKVIACQTCGGLYSNRTKFFDHVKRQIPAEDQQYQCSHCSKNLASERLLRDHMRSHINHYKCPFCDMTCSNPSNLSSHIKYRHEAERPFSCNFCEYSSKTQVDLCKHLRTHLSEPQERCQYANCSFATRSEHALKNHVIKEHKKDKLPRYCCHMCEKTFARGASLTRHLFTKHKFRWPSGHSRFRYKQNPDGTHQLQTIRYESIELTREMIDQVPTSQITADQASDDDMSAEEGEALSIDLNCSEAKGEDIADVAQLPETQIYRSMEYPVSESVSSQPDLSIASVASVPISDDTIQDWESCKTIMATFTGADGVVQQVSISVEERPNEVS